MVLLSDDSRPATASSSATEKKEEEDPGHRRLVARCVEALHHVIKRYPEHYKTVYRLAHYYFTSKVNRSVGYLLRDLTFGRSCLLFAVSYVGLDDLEFMEWVTILQKSVRDGQ